MRAELEARLYAGIILGIVVQLIGSMIANTSKEGAMIGFVISIAGLVAFVWGCMSLAQVKGYSKWLGLLGILSCIGLIALILLPDHSRRSRRSQP